MITDVLYVVMAALFSAAAFLALYRVVRGPSILDRMIASDVLLTTTMLVVGAEMVLNGHTSNVPIMLALAVVAIFATVAVARFVSQQDEKAGDAA